MAPFDWKRTGKFCAAAATLDFASFTYIVCLPYLAMEFGAESLQLGYMASARNVAYVVACLTLGRLADRFGRRGLMGLGAGVMAAVYVFTAFTPRLGQGPALFGVSPAMWALYLSGVVWGLGLSLWWPPFFAWAGDVHHGEALGRATGAINLSWSLGCTVGAPVAGALYLLGAPVPFVFACLFAAFAVSLFLFAPQGQGRPSGKSSSRTPPGTKRDLAAAWLGNVSGCALIGLMLAVFPELGKELGVTPAVFGVLGFALGVGRTAIFFAGFRAARGLGQWQWSLATLMLAACMTATVAWVESLLWLGLVFVCLGVAMGFAYFRGLYASLQHEGSRAAKAGAHEAALVLGMLVGSLGGGWMAGNLGLRAPYLPIACFVAVLVAAQAALCVSSRRAAARFACGAEGG